MLRRGYHGHLSVIRQGCVNNQFGTAMEFSCSAYRPVRIQVKTVEREAIRLCRGESELGPCIAYGAAVEGGICGVKSCSAPPSQGMRT